MAGLSRPMKQHEEKTDMEAVAINPSMVFGKSLSNDYGTSNLVIKRLIDGSLPFTLNICIIYANFYFF